MRFYRLKISPKGGGQAREFSSLIGGRNNPGALTVEFDLPVIPYATPMGGAWIRLWGISRQDISQASDFNGAAIEFYGGMSAGLPLANPAQAGLLVRGTAWQSWGNWEMISQTLEFIVLPGSDTSTDAEKKNITLNWKNGTPLADAIKSTLQTAYSGFQIGGSINSKLVLSSDQVGIYATLTEFSQFIKQISKTIIGGTYPGVDIVLKDKTFTMYDGTTPGAEKSISFKDLIGQPTWIESPKIQLKCVLRADLGVGDAIRMPQGVQTINTAAAQSQFRDKSVFQGQFVIVLVRHVGNSRQSDGSSWATIIEAIPVMKPAT